MDANFMNVKEMKYNVERKKITFTWKRDDEEEGKITYILLLFIHNLLLSNIPTHPQYRWFYFIYTIILWLYLRVVVCFTDECCCLFFVLLSGKILDMLRGGSRASATAEKSTEEIQSVAIVREEARKSGRK